MIGEAIGGIFFFHDNFISESNNFMSASLLLSFLLLALFKSISLLLLRGSFSFIRSLFLLFISSVRMIELLAVMLLLIVVRRFVKTVVLVPPLVLLWRTATNDGSASSDSIVSGCLDFRDPGGKRASCCAKIDFG